MSSGQPRHGRGVVVEFTGPPGGGKSSVAAHMASAARALGLCVLEPKDVKQIYLHSGPVRRLVEWYSPHARYRRSSHLYERYQTPALLQRFAWTHPRAWSTLRRRIRRLRSEAPDEAARVEHWVERAVLIHEMARARAAHFDLFPWEEGIAHRALNLFASPRGAPDAAAVTRFLSGWAFPDAVVHVTAAPGDCVARMGQRGLPERLVGRSDAEIHGFVESASLVSEAIAAEARRRRLRVFEIHNDADSLDDLLDRDACLALEEALPALAAGEASGAGPASARSPAPG